MNNAIKYINLAKKAGAVIYGIDNIINNKNIILILLCPTASSNLVDKTLNFVNKKNIKLIKLQDSLDKILNTTNCKVIGITNKQLATQIENLLKEE